MDKVYTEDEVKKLIKMSHILGTGEYAFDVTERHEIIKRDRHLYGVGENVSEMIINYDKEYLSWSPEYLVWYKTTFNSFPHNNNSISANHIDELLSLKDKIGTIDELKVVTFDQYKAYQLKLQRISKEMDKQVVKAE